MKNLAGVIAVTIVTAGYPSTVNARNKAEAAKPAGNPGDWFDQNSYPKEAIRAGAQGRVVVDIVIDERGVPSQCSVFISAGNAALDQVTCDLAMKKARFTPARDTDGRAISSKARLPVRWVLPTGMGPARTFSFVDRLKIAPDGTLISCEVERASPKSDHPNESCDLFRNKSSLLTLALRGGETGGTVTAYFQMALTMDGDPAPSYEHQVEGRILTGMVRATIDIAADGTVSSCRVIDSVGGLGRFPACQMMLGPFEAAEGAMVGKARSGTILTGFSYEARKP